MTLQIQITSRPKRILHFDLENRPSTYWYDGKATAEITAIAWSWAGEEKIHARLLLPHDLEESMFRMLSDFQCVYNTADIVTGHYIRKHDLPLINSHFLEFGFKPFAPKEVSDTYADLSRHAGMSMSQESLASFLQVEDPKIQMTQFDWREGNRLRMDGMKKVKQRCVFDVAQHKGVRDALILRDYLKPARVWRP